MNQSMALLKEEFMQEGILMCFNGPFSHEIIEELGSAIKKHLASEQLAHAALMDLFAIFIEQTQNVRNYTMQIPVYNQEPAKLQSAIVLIGKQGNKYWVHSGNYIANEDLPSLTARLDQLNSLGKDELRRLYKTQLRQEMPPTSTGAGLGLIDMARRMSEPFAYTSERIDDNYSFFSVRVIV
ncbi:MAG TPA: SiaB family protein kinase [Armatimonadota bacterium]|nr:SiaB family protein kinase [Armatimonadota bacterium]